LASVGHVIVGVYAACYARGSKNALRYPWSSPIVLSGLSLLPDLDVIGFGFGIAYEDAFGHRGATHSILFAVVIAVGGAVIARIRGEPALRVFVLVGLVVLSHGLLDMLTDGGLGVAIFFPSNTRYFFPWRPLPVAPIGRAFFSPYGARVAATESAYLAPLIALSLWSLLRRDRTPSTR
jgi:inner membrane protein